MIPQSALSGRGDGHGVTERERRMKREEEKEVEEITTAREEISSGLEGSEDEATESGYRKRGESLKGFPFSPNLACECTFSVAPPSFNSPLRLSHTNRTIICYSDSPGDKEEEGEQEREGRDGGWEGERKRPFTNTDVKVFHMITAPLNDFHDSMATYSLDAASLFCTVTERNDCYSSEEMPLRHKVDYRRSTL